MSMIVSVMLEGHSYTVDRCYDRYNPFTEQRERVTVKEITIDDDGYTTVIFTGTRHQSCFAPCELRSYIFDKKD